MIQWLIKLGTPGWEAVDKSRPNFLPGLALVAKLIELVVVLACGWRLFQALAVDDYAQATFFMVAAFIAMKRTE